jgi:signal transduction histidine kinase/ActR/RegA family two-component response regulator
MEAPDADAREQCILILASTARDAANSVAVLSKAGLECSACRDLEEVCREVALGAGAVMLTEESLALDQYQCLIEALAEQPPWSDLPIVLLTRGGRESPAATRAMNTLGNVILLERPIRVFTLVTAARTALRARNKQYQIRAKIEELRQANIRKDEFLATLAHELRNPLAPVLHGLSVMKFSNDREIRTEARQMMERQIGHMVRLIDDLMDVSRITRGKVELKRERLDLRRILEHALELSRPLIEAAKHELSVSIPESPLPVEADATRVAQVVSNLLNNAAKYTPDGGSIQLDATMNDDELVVRVRDNGTGIPADMLPEVFEMFTQVGRTIDRAKGGLGIGLTLARRLVEMHGGTLTAESGGPGQGSTFVVTLPLAEAGSQEVATPNEQPAGANAVRRKRVLVVDDNIDGAESLAMMLQYFGHETCTAHDGPSALETSREFHPDLLFLDIGLPGMNGYELARQLRREPDANGMILVALTGWGSEDDRRQAREAGFDYHLTKPAGAIEIQKIFADSARSSRRM